MLWEKYRRLTGTVATSADAVDAIDAIDAADAIEAAAVDAGAQENSNTNVDIARN